MFRFTIRDVLWLTLSLGLALGWLLRVERLNEQIARARIDVIRAEDERDYWKLWAGLYQGVELPSPAQLNRP